MKRANIKKMIAMALWVLPVLWVLPGAVLPGMAAEKGKAEPYTVVTSEELKAMIERQEPGLVVIDARTPDEYQEVHIQNAVNIPWPKLQKDKSLLNFAKEAKLVFYCNGFK